MLQWKVGCMRSEGGEVASTNLCCVREVLLRATNDNDGRRHFATLNQKDRSLIGYQRVCV